MLNYNINPNNEVIDPVSGYSYPESYSDAQARVEALREKQRSEREMSHYASLFTSMLK